MDPVFDAQYRIIKDGFADRGVRLDIAYSPSGDVDFVYAAGHLLGMVSADRPVDRLSTLLPGLRLLPDELQPPAFGASDTASARAAEGGRLMLFTMDGLDEGELTVPEALNLLDSRIGGRERSIVQETGQPMISPDHLVHITRLCPAVEPEVPPGRCPQPWPGPQEPSTTEREVALGICDTGLLENLNVDEVPWLAGVTGEPDLLPTPLLDGRQRIPGFAGHGTFIAGVARCLAPTAGVVVTDHFSTSGAELESEMVRKLDGLAARTPELICLSAGTYTRGDWGPLGFSDFRRRWPDLVLVAAAGNEGTDRPFYPAAFDWATAVGALGADQRHRAWFSNYGDWVDVYAPGEGLVNAYATGEYTYVEPPRRPARQTFAGMARWSGTSFAAPVVAGLIAQHAALTGHGLPEAAREVLDQARSQAVNGIGPVLTLDE